jgi:hypothetical protein
MKPIYVTFFDGEPLGYFEKIDTAHRYIIERARLLENDLKRRYGKSAIDIKSVEDHLANSVTITYRVLGIVYDGPLITNTYSYAELHVLSDPL